MNNVTDIRTKQDGIRLGLDEKVEWLWEADKDKPMFGSYRYQHIQLARDGEMHHFVWEMGLSSEYPLAHPFNFFAGGYYSVGEALEIADNLRQNKPPEEHEPIDLAMSYLKLIEERHKRRRHASTFGRYLQVVR